MVLKERGYRQVNLPIPLVERIEKYLTAHKEEGWKNTPNTPMSSESIKKFHRCVPCCYGVFKRTKNIPIPD
jgi:hypothetical protein